MHAKRHFGGVWTLSLKSALRLCAPHVRSADSSRRETAGNARVCEQRPSRSQATRMRASVIAWFEPWHLVQLFGGIRPTYAPEQEPRNLNRGHACWALRITAESVAMNPSTAVPTSTAVQVEPLHTLISLPHSDIVWYSTGERSDLAIQSLNELCCLRTIHQSKRLAEGRLVRRGSLDMHMVRCSIGGGRE